MPVHRAVTEQEAVAFCRLCDWTYETWVTHKCLFDDNHSPANNIGRSPWFTSRLSVITQEYALLQIAKLHDPWRQRGSINLTVGYIVECGEWGAEKSSIVAIRNRLNTLHESLRGARSKALAHNDLDTLIANENLGSFPKGTDDRYFDALQDLANEVHAKWVGVPYPFNDLAKTDALEFLKHLERNPPRSRHHT